MQIVLNLVQPCWTCVEALERCPFSRGSDPLAGLTHLHSPQNLNQTCPKGLFDDFFVFSPIAFFFLQPTGRIVLHNQWKHFQRANDNVPITSIFHAHGVYIDCQTSKTELLASAVFHACYVSKRFYFSKIFLALIYLLNADDD